MDFDLAKLHALQAREQTKNSTLAPGDRVALERMVREIHEGQNAVVIVQEPNGRLGYMFLSGTRLEAVEMMGTVISEAARRSK